MTTALSLHIGLIAVDPNEYGGWSGELNACEADADSMEAIASSRTGATIRGQGTTPRRKRAM